MTECDICHKKANMSVTMRLLEQSFMHEFIGMEGKKFKEKLCTKCRMTINTDRVKILTVRKIK